MYFNSSLPAKTSTATTLPIATLARPQLQFQLFRKSMKAIFIVIFLAVLLIASSLLLMYSEQLGTADNRDTNINSVTQTGGYTSIGNPAAIVKR